MSAELRRPFLGKIARPWRGGEFPSFHEKDVVDVFHSEDKFQQKSLGIGEITDVLVRNKKSTTNKKFMYLVTELKSSNTGSTAYGNEKPRKWTVSSPQLKRASKFILYGQTSSTSTFTTGSGSSWNCQQETRRKNWST